MITNTKTVKDMDYRKLFGGKHPIIGIQDCGCTIEFPSYVKSRHDIDLYMKYGIVPLVKNIRGYVEDCKDGLAYLDDEYNGSVYGVGVPDHWDYAFVLAEEYHASFVMIDSIDVMPQLESGFEEMLAALRRKHPGVAVFGSMVYPRYSDLGFEGELLRLKQQCDALVYMGDREDCTSLNGKLDEIKAVLGDFPILAGEQYTEDQCTEIYLQGDGAVLDAWLKDRRSVLGNVDETFVAGMAKENERFHQ